MSTVDERYSQAEKLKDAGQAQEARDLLLGILEESPEHVLSHLTLARIFTGLGEHQRAVAHAEKACQIEPNEGFNFTLLSVTYQRAYAGTGDTSYIRMAEDAMARSRML
jgi:predicted Zn-dependent protease